ncbi:UDP-N-acetylmuramoylalanine--D-glutamate ligase [Candidatus Profftia lariciata]|uniref:UDP-N-acetylmuramoyl-L-alanine--D-glutamate ligase n=1 Tax=Candidatus Profftia lariciata TaxID=1987921 RepID=UPI001D0225E4|nr:UDP-N-acetylmuramoyl-L-alanine--D-glutamate ligase [Candidatus Profftia lariciata]UDG81389.1 UDP-N-acetylmuramoylalanine--D-glutamate ligase [Candidatus Profftia lariciata]
MVNYQGQKIVILGLGITGISCINFFITLGVKPRVIDTRVSPPNLDKLPKNIEYHLGNINQDWLMDADLIIVSPSINLADPALRLAAKMNIKIISDIELLCRESKVPIVAITGSNGKSTVTTLVGHMAKSAGWKVGVGGNIGIPALTLLQQEYDLYVLELSSFQLETTINLQAAVATILNVTEDHMDRYPLGLQQYHAVKLSIYNNAKICIINADDKLTMPICKNFSNYLSFGVNVGNYYLNNYRGETWLCVNGTNILNTYKINITGQHNLTNILAALALSDAIGIPRFASIKALTTFSGLPHIFQLVLENNGVRWINDSKATNVHSTIAAFNNLHVDGILHLLLGGNGKSANFSSLTQYIQGDNIRLYCFGRDSRELAKLRFDIAEITDTMESAMRIIATKVKSGDVVLLSPACASTDQFENFAQRGNEFTLLAKELG